jgi:hypothetical protein
MKLAFLAAPRALAASASQLLQHAATAGDVREAFRLTSLPAFAVVPAQREPSL